MWTSAKGNPLKKKKHESGAFREVRRQDSRWGGGGGRVSGRGEGGRWSSWWDWSPGSNSLRRQDWSKTDWNWREVLASGWRDIPPPPLLLLFLIHSNYSPNFHRNWTKPAGKDECECDVKVRHWPWSKLSFLLDEPSPRPSMSTRSLLTSESFNALRVTSARGKGSKSIWINPNPLPGVSGPTCCLLFLDGHGQRGAVLHARGHNHLGGGHSHHGGRGGSWCRRRGYGCLLHRFFGWLGGNWNSAVLIQLPLHCALNLSPARDERERLGFHTSMEFWRL